MRTVGPALLLLFFLPAPATAHGTVDDGHGSLTPGNHSASVQEFRWFEPSPARGAGVTAVLTPVPQANLTSATLNVCRVESYSCRAPIAMTRGTNGVWATYVAWDNAFYRGARTIGLALQLQHANGTVEKSPLTDWPERPAEMPGSDAAYYYYTLPPEERGAPGAVAWTTFCVLAFIVGRRR